MVQPALQYALSAREYELLRGYVTKKVSKVQSKRSIPFDAPSHDHDHNAAAFRSALRVFLATKGGLSLWESISARLLMRQSSKSPRPSKPLVASSSKLALSLASILFFHRVLFRFFSRLRLQLLHEKAKAIRQRYPHLFAALTSKLAPAVGASLAGLALGICPADQLRLTVAIYTGARSLEFLYNALAAAGYIRNVPWWFGSWLLFPLAQGQLLHAFVFDRDCFPAAYGSFILKYSSTYVPAKPSTISPRVAWPSANQIVDALAQIANSNWPPFISPILQPSTISPLAPILNPLTSRASPLIPHLSCALLHPSDPSCFTAYLTQNLTAFPLLTRFFTLYYGAFALLRYRKFRAAPIDSFNRLAAQILRTTAAISGAISASWGSICLFAMILPRSFLPRFRFFLGGMLGGCFQFLDRGGAGRTNSLYAARVSADSLWKVGVKHGWWRGVRGGDVWVFVTSLAVLNVCYEWKGVEAVESGAASGLLRLLRGEIDVGLKGGGKVEEVAEEVGEKKGI